MSNVESEPKNLYQEMNRTLISEVIACSDLKDEPNDVLCANGFFRVLPALIRNKDAETLVRATEILGEEAKNVDQDKSSIKDIKIAQRDLSMFVTAAALSVQDIPEGEFPNADEIVPVGAKELVRLSQIIDLPPRASDANWTGMNPRYFTDGQVEFMGRQVKAEALVKICVGKNWELQEQTTESIMALTKVGIEDPKFAEVAKKASEDLSPLVSGITVMVANLTKTDVGKHYFIEDFMPRTKPFNINGETVIHSGSQFFPLHLADALLGNTDNTNENHISYRQQNVKSATIKQKVQFEKALEYVQERGTLSEQIMTRPELLSSAEGINSILRVIAQFRNAHGKAIEESEMLRQNGESSGMQLPMAYELRDRTVEIRNNIRGYIKHPETNT